MHRDDAFVEEVAKDAQGVDGVHPGDVEHVLESTLRMAWNELRHRARLVKNYAKVPLVEANESRLGQVFLNLIINAVHAIPMGNYEGNQITISTALDARGLVVVIVYMKVLLSDGRLSRRRGHGCAPSPLLA